MFPKIQQSHSHPHICEQAVPVVGLETGTSVMPLRDQADALTAELSRLN